MIQKKPRMFYFSKGEISASTLIILLSILLLSSIILTIFLSRIDEFSATGYATSGQIKRTIAQDSRIIQIMGYDGLNGYFDEMRIDLQLAVNSYEVDLYETPITLRGSDWSVFLEYRNGTPVQNASGYYVNQTNNITGDATGYYQIEYLRMSDSYMGGRFQRGEVIRIFSSLPVNITENQFFQVQIHLAQGIEKTKTVFTGHTLLGESYVVLFPSS